jgi:hypothetical protein
LTPLACGHCFHADCYKEIAIEDVHCQICGFKPGSIISKRLSEVHIAETENNHSGTADKWLSVNINDPNLIDVLLGLHDRLLQKSDSTEGGAFIDALKKFGNRCIGNSCFRPKVRSEVDDSDEIEREKRKGDEAVQNPFISEERYRKELEQLKAEVAALEDKEREDSALDSMEIRECKKRIKECEETIERMGLEIKVFDDIDEKDQMWMLLLGCVMLSGDDSQTQEQDRSRRRKVYESRATVDVILLGLIMDFGDANPQDADKKIEMRNAFPGVFRDDNTPWGAACREYKECLTSIKATKGSLYTSFEKRLIKWKELLEKARADAASTSHGSDVYGGGSSGRRSTAAPFRRAIARNVVGAQGNRRQGAIALLTAAVATLAAVTALL